MAVNLPRTPLGFFPTPFHELPQFTASQNGPSVYIKRDDLTGLALGGNKTRKLEFLLADALENGCDTIVTAGAAQSNHCRQTAAAAAKLGIECHLLLGGNPPANVNGNLLLDSLFGANIVWCGEQRKGEGIPAYIDELKKANKKPYLVPYGGSNPIGATSFYVAMQELSEQVDLKAFSRIVFASSSGATHAGLLLGAKQFAPHLEVLGIKIDKESANEQPFAELVLSLTKATRDYLQLPFEVTEADVLLNTAFTAGGYGVVGALERSAISTLASTEGILLDPVYTGRAFGGLMKMIEQQQISAQEKVIFWHTGGAPALFSYNEQILS